MIELLLLTFLTLMILCWILFLLPAKRLTLRPVKPYKLQQYTLTHEQIEQLDLLIKRFEANRLATRKGTRR